jgi:hypothetical protein
VGYRAQPFCQRRIVELNCLIRSQRHHDKQTGAEVRVHPSLFFM